MENKLENMKIEELKTTIKYEGKFASDSILNTIFNMVFGDVSIEEDEDGKIKLNLQYLGLYRKGDKISLDMTKDGDNFTVQDNNTIFILHLNKSLKEIPENTKLLCRYSTIFPSDSGFIVTIKSVENTKE